MNILDGNDSDISEGAPIRLGVDPKIDWFYFETKMRALIQEMLEPTMRRSNEDNIEIKYVKKLYDEIRDRCNELDYKIGRLIFIKFKFLVLISFT